MTPQIDPDDDERMAMQSPWQQRQRQATSDVDVARQLQMRVDTQAMMMIEKETLDLRRDAEADLSLNPLANQGWSTNQTEVMSFMPTPFSYPAQDQPLEELEVDDETIARMVQVAMDAQITDEGKPTNPYPHYLPVVPGQQTFRLPIRSVDSPSDGTQQPQQRQSQANSFSSGKRTRDDEESSPSQVKRLRDKNSQGQPPVRDPPTQFAAPSPSIKQRCHFCTSLNIPCDADFDHGIECSMCTTVRFGGVNLWLGPGPNEEHDCIFTDEVANTNVTYYRQYLPGMAPRAEELDQQCDACAAAGPGGTGCTVDQFLRIGCHGCEASGQPCTFQGLSMRPRPALPPGVEPWFRHGCDMCSAFGWRCSWMHDRGSRRQRCQLCVMRGVHLCQLNGMTVPDVRSTPEAEREHNADPTQARFPALFAPPLPPFGHPLPDLDEELGPIANDEVMDVDEDEALGQGQDQDRGLGKSQGQGQSQNQDRTQVPDQDENEDGDSDDGLPPIPRMQFLRQGHGRASIARALSGPGSRATRPPGDRNRCSSCIIHRTFRCKYNDSQRTVACFRCHELGLVCEHVGASTLFPAGHQFPYLDRRLVGFGFAPASLFFTKCTSCRVHRRDCDRVQPCEACVRHGADATCDLRLARGVTWPRDRIAPGQGSRTYFMALGMGPLGPGSSRALAADGELVGPSTPVYALDDETQLKPPVPVLERRARRDLTGIGQPYFPPAPRALAVTQPVALVPAAAIPPVLVVAPATVLDPALAPASTPDPDLAAALVEELESVDN